MKQFKLYFRIALVCFLGSLITSCGLFILAVGGLEKDISADLTWAHLLNKVYGFREDVFVYRFNDDTTFDVVTIGTFGSFSLFPSSVIEYEQNREKYPFIIKIIPAGTQFSINKIIALTYPSGNTHEAILIDLYGYDFCGYRIDAAFVYYRAGEHIGTLKPRWIREVGEAKSPM